MTQEFKDHIVQHPNRFKRVPVAGTTDQFDLIPTWVENPSEVVQLGTPIDRQLFEGITSQLAETRAELEARVSETIANAGDGTIPTELVDMRVSKEGTVFTVAGDYVRFLEDVMKIETKNVGEATTTVYDFFNVANDGGVSSASPYRKWGMKLVPMPFTANKIKIKVKTGNVTAGAKAVVEVRANLNGTLLATGSADLSTTQDYVDVTLDSDVALDNGVVITAWQELGGSVLVMPFVRSTTKDTNIDTTTDEGVYYNTSDVASEVVISAGSTFKGLVFALQFVAQEVERVITNVKPQAVVKGKTLEVAKSGAVYSTIQAAVNDAVDGDTVLVHPGLYQEAVDAKSKEINIVGVSKKNTILYNNTSDYYTPPLEIAAGMVKGLTIIEDHSNPDPAIANESVYAWERAYSIHIDYPFAQGKKLIIDDCILKNSKRHTLGIGTFQDNEIVIQNCDIWTGTATRTGLDTAGVYFHNQTVEQNITNQKVRLINNVVYSDSKYALIIQDVTKPGYVSQLECEFINNMFYSKTDGKDCVKGGFTTNITLSPNSYGNNLAMLNASL